MDRYPDYRRAIRLAYQTLLRLHVARLPVDIVTILGKCKNTRIVPYSKAEKYNDPLGLNFPAEAPSDYAFTYRIAFPDGSIAYLLLYNDELYQSPERLRFTLAHELGHIVLKHRQDSYVEDMEADTFAQHLLCPEPLMEPMRADANAWIMSLAFGLSMSAVRVILREQRRAFYVGANEKTALQAAFGVPENGRGAVWQAALEKQLKVRGL